MDMHCTHTHIFPQMSTQYELSGSDAPRIWPDNPTISIKQENVFSILDLWNEEDIFQPDVERNLPP